MAKPAVSAFRALASDKRVAMLRALQERDGPMGVEELAAVVDLHVNTVREHLDRLVGSGLVTSAPEVRTTRGRPRMLYASVRHASGAEDQDAWSRDTLMRLLVAGYGRHLPSPSEAAEEAGQEWGRSLVHRCDGDESGVDDAAGQLSALAASLDQLGFDPEVDLRRREVTLRRCPFRDVSGDRPDVVCGIHLGIVRGVLAEHGGPVVAQRIEGCPSTEGTCVVHLTHDEPGLMR